MTKVVSLDQIVSIIHCGPDVYPDNRLIMRLHLLLSYIIFGCPHTIHNGYGYVASQPHVDGAFHPRMEAARLSKQGFRADSRRQEGRRGDPPGLYRVSILSCPDRRNLPGSLSDRGEAGVRSHLDRVVSTGSKVRHIPLPCMAPARSTVIFSQCRHVALKLFLRSESMGSELDNELNVYKRIESAPKDHPGRSAVRSLLDSFDVDGPKARHRCLVHPPLWERVLDIRHRNPVRRLPEPVVAFVLKRLFQALDLLHKECHVVHTDIKEANVLLGVDESVLRVFEKEELEEPCPRKELDGGTIYLSRELNTPRDFGAPVLCDLGSAVPLDDGVEHREDLQPDVYRAPEVILDVPWTYSVDIWNVGCVVSGETV